MFELFALEVCKLYFSCDFVNLNFERNNYPSVDLLSTNNDIYVQVSTCENVPSKIKNTLTDIESSKDEKVKNVSKLYFFVLNNDSIKNVKNYTGKNKIGKIDFKKDEHLITTEKILKRAENNLEFQEHLYEICYKDENILDYQRFNEAIDDSKTLIEDITDTIGGKYQINIDNLINEIEKDNSKFILVTGQAGSGKSVLCKKFVQRIGNFLYVKAERILELNDINEIWNFNVSNVLKSVSNCFYIFIDSLEFVADNRTKLDILKILFKRLESYNNIKVVCSCRESDRSSFFKIENDFGFSIHCVPPISNDEINSISKEFLIVKELAKEAKYKDLLCNPFYLNCLTKINDITVIKNEDDLRNIIWHKMVCLYDKNNEQIINELVLDRAKNFLLGSDESKYDSNRINKLVSGNSIIKHNGKIRLKYDIFEDICFERHIDSLFDNCKGDYSIFFDNLHKLGRCIYRRLQIWIENKLFSKNNRDKFLYVLLNSEQIPIEWKKQIEIGIIKSRHSYDFLIENSDTLVGKNYINELVKLANLYGFEIAKVKTSDFSIKLKPIGVGRNALIKIIFEKCVYKSEKIDENDISKLISDAIRADTLTTDVAIISCQIIQYFVDKVLSDDALDYYDKYSLCKTNIKILLNLSNYCSAWLKGYIKTLLDHLSSHKASQIRYATDSISDLICFDNGNLASSNYDDVIELFSHFFTDNLDDDRFMHYSNRDLNDNWKYGFNDNAESYMQDYRDYPANFSTCFWLLLKKNYWKTLGWLISFLNRCVSQYNKNESLPEFDLYFVDEQTHKKYLGNERMWLASCQEYQVPTIVGDLVFTLEKFTEYGASLLEYEEKKKFLETIKIIIFDSSNNIILIASILHFGLKYANDIPGYAIDLASNLDIVLMDCSRHSLAIKNPAKDVLEKEILKKVGLPSLKNQRYNENIIDLDFRNYIFNSQLATESVVEKCKEILNYLYSSTKNNKENALKYLQIESMDLKKASLVKIDNERYLVTTNHSGEAQKCSEKINRINQPIDEIYKILKETQKEMEANNLTDEEAKEKIFSLINYVNHPFFPAISNEVFALLSLCLKKDELTLKLRNELCNIWINLLSQKQNNASIIIDCRFYKFLFEQLKFEIDIDIKNKIKRIILDSFISNDQSDLSNTELKRISREYLKTDKQTSRLVFNTIISLAEDEMKHQKYNFAYYKRKQAAKETFKPNLIPHLAGIDYAIKQDGSKAYSSNKNEIINEYLFNEHELIIKNFNIDNYDLNLLCSAVECANDFDSINVIIRQILLKIIEIYHVSKKSYNSHDIFDIYKQHDIKNLFKEFLLNEEISNTMISILFDEIDFSIFVPDTYDFYVEIFDGLVSYYYDDYKSHKIRSLIESELNEVERKILSIDNEVAKSELSKILIVNS